MMDYFYSRRDCGPLVCGYENGNSVRFSDVSSLETCVGDRPAFIHKTSGPTAIALLGGSWPSLGGSLGKYSIPRNPLPTKSRLEKGYVVFQGYFLQYAILKIDFYLHKRNKFHIYIYICMFTNTHIFLRV